MIHSQILERIQETPSTVTLKFDWIEKVLPGQFIMIWVPGQGEIPMSMSFTGKPKGITVKAYGPPSRQLQQMGRGDTLYFRGPYGVPFTEIMGAKLIVGAGSGIASLLPLVDRNSTVMVSAKTESDLIYRGKINAKRIIYLTDDGTYGIKGFPDQVIKDVHPDDFEYIYVCGPEAMMYKVLLALKGRNDRAEFSLERSMKCGIGICDSCSIDGIQLCREGPVRGIGWLRESKEFGMTKLDRSGRRVRIEL